MKAYTADIKQLAENLRRYNAWLRDMDDLSFGKVATPSRSNMR